MSTEYITNDTDLKSVADAIRAKTGKSDPLTFPAEFASEIAGIETGGGTDLSLGLTGATVGQIAKITAVDSNGKPTAWEPVDMPSGGGGELQWIKVASVVTEEETNVLSIGTDGEGREISGYHPLAMIASFALPADTTQSSTSGVAYAYPAATKLSNVLRYSLSFSSWKTNNRGFNVFFTGLPRVFYGSTAANTDIVNSNDKNLLNGVYAIITTSGDHFPIGTKVNVAVLSKGWSE